EKEEDSAEKSEKEQKDAKEDTERTSEKASSSSKEEKSSSDDKNYASGTPSPAAKKTLAEKDIDPKNVSGSGKNGRITKEDAVNAKASMGTPGSGSRSEKRKRMSMMRRKTA